MSNKTKAGQPVSADEQGQFVRLMSVLYCWLLRRLTDAEAASLLHFTANQNKQAKAILTQLAGQLGLDIEKQIRASQPAELGPAKPKIILGSAVNPLPPQPL